MHPCCVPISNEFNKAQQYISVYPHLTIANYSVNSEDYKYVVVNNGIGPALIKSLKVVDNQGKSYPDVVYYVKKNLVSTAVGAMSSDLYFVSLQPFFLRSCGSSASALLNFQTSH